MKSFSQYFFEAINGPKIIMIGGPGSGKSTYSEFITKHFDIPHIYTGDMMRKLAKTDNKVKDLLAKGKFAPTDIVIKAVLDRLKKPDARNGYVFDGFPRSMEQVNAMDKNNIDVNFIINLQVSEKEVIKRLTARGRADDKPEIIKQRLATHEKEVSPVIDHYKERLINIKAEGDTPENIAKSIIKRIEK